MSDVTTPSDTPTPDGTGEEHGQQGGSHAATSRTPRAQRPAGTANLVPDFRQGLENLLAHKLRSLLTMLGIIFGVAAVVSMMSIGAGAQQQVMAFIEDLGVHNLIVEAKEAPDGQTLQRIRRISPGLTFNDFRSIKASIAALIAATPRKRSTPTKLLPKPQREMPALYGVEPSYRTIAGLRTLRGRFFDEDDNQRAAPVCVLGAAARSNLFGAADPIGQMVKVNEQWFRVIGELGSQLSVEGSVPGVPAQDRNNVIYVPLTSALLRVEDSYSRLKDEIDGIYLQLGGASDSVATADVVRGILNISHHNADDFSLVVPAELLAEQRRTQRIFDMVMVALASISLLVGGIGIMNIMLASVLERTREVGVRRAVGARQLDIVRQFLLETITISFVGGAIGLLFGVSMSRLIAFFAGWSTIVTASSVVLAFAVSVSVGLVFGVYPALKAARLDPVEALHYE
jgi:putative ABC transport system permease protein